MSPPLLLRSLHPRPSRTSLLLQNRYFSPEPLPRLLPLARHARAARSQCAHQAQVRRFATIRRSQDTKRDHGGLRLVPCQLHCGARCPRQQARTRAAATHPRLRASCRRSSRSTAADIPRTGQAAQGEHLQQKEERMGLAVHAAPVRKAELRICAVFSVCECAVWLLHYAQTVDVSAPAHAVSELCESGC